MRNESGDEPGPFPRLYRTIVEQCADAVVVIDRDQIIRFANPAASAIFGYEHDGLLGRPLEVMLPTRFRSAHHSLVHWFEASPEEARFMGERWRVLHGLRADGEEFPVDVSIVKADVDGARYFVAIVRDMSDFRRQERHLRDAMLAAEAASISKSAFIANMSHEIRTPLNAVMGMASAMAACDLTQDQRGYVETIREAGETLLDILNDVLDLSKIEAGITDIEIRDVDLASLIGGVEALWMPRAQAKGLSLVARHDPRAPAVVKTDANRIRQILNNLIGNAIKFTDEGSIEVGTETREGSGGEAAIRFFVRDTGIGMTGEQMQTVFDRFVQGDESPKRRHGGVGLGLAISKNLAELLGGEIGVESRPGDGSCFWFTVPATPGSAAATASEGPTGTADRDRLREHPLRILVAEDNKINQRVITVLLGSLDCRVTVVETGREALDAVSDGTYDVVLMDIQMPEMDGVEATMAIRALDDPEKAAVPIVAVTANAMAGDRERYLKSGMDAYISKPIESAGLVDAITRCVRPGIGSRLGGDGGAGTVSF